MSADGIGNRAIWRRWAGVCLAWAAAGTGWAQDEGFMDEIERKSGPYALQVLVGRTHRRRTA